MSYLRPEPEHVTHRTASGALHDVQEIKGKPDKPNFVVQILNERGWLDYSGFQTLGSCFLTIWVDAVRKPDSEFRVVER